MKKSIVALSCLLAVINADGSLADTESTGTDVMRIMAVIPYAHSAYHQDSGGMLQYSLGAATTIGLTSATKRLVSRERPNGHGNNSFPSGHASSAFDSAFYVAERYSYLEATPYFLGAGYVAYSRVEANKHDWVDVGAGAGLAYVVNHYFTSKYDSRDPTKPRIGFHTTDKGKMMFTFQLDW